MKVLLVSSYVFFNVAAFPTLCDSLLPSPKLVQVNNFTLRCATAVLPAGPVPSAAMPTRILPCGDELDKRIVTLAIPAVANFLILPLVGAVDTFWVGRMGNALSLAGQGAANQVF